MSRGVDPLAGPPVRFGSRAVPDRVEAWADERLRVSAGTAQGMTTHDEALRAKESVEHDWLRRPGVTGIDVGVATPAEGRSGERFVIRVYVENLPEARRSSAFPMEVQGVGVVLVERKFKLH